MAKFRRQQTLKDLPFQGRFVAAKDKLFAETIVFVHHYGGNRSSVKPHQDFVRDLGFDSVSFTLSFPKLPQWIKVPVVDHVHFRLRQRWQKEISEVLDAIPGKKILFTFSFPSAPAAIAMSQRRTKDISAWICDGGPFLMPITCFWNYFTHIEPTQFLPLKGLKLAAGFAALEFWSLPNDLKTALDLFPSQFPVLSIRAWQDRLVPIAAIDEVFHKHSQLHLETLTLAEADHINGFQKFPAEYKPRVAEFLNKYAQKLNTST